MGRAPVQLRASCFWATKGLGSIRLSDSEFNRAQRFGQFDALMARATGRATAVHPPVGVLLRVHFARIRKKLGK